MLGHFREKGVPGRPCWHQAVPCFSSGHSHAHYGAASPPPPFSGNCYGFCHPRAFPRGFIFLGSSPFPPFGLINFHSSLEHCSVCFSREASPDSWTWSDPTLCTPPPPPALHLQSIPSQSSVRNKLFNASLPALDCKFPEDRNCCLFCSACVPKA